MNISIAIATHNRKRQLLNSLWSIQHTKGDYPVEIIIVDDNSDDANKLTHKDLIKYDLDIKYYYKTGRIKQDPVIPNNLAFAHCSGDVILMSCAEIIHVGNIVGHATKYMDDSKFMVYSTYAINWELYNKINRLRWSNPKVINKVKEIISPLAECAQHESSSGTGWYAHPHYKNLELPFCAAITRKNMELLSGYDERFYAGIGKADNDFVRRVHLLGLNTEWIINIYAIHQPHEPTDYANLELVLRNDKLANELKELGNIKATENQIYRR